MADAGGYIIMRLEQEVVDFLVELYSRYEKDVEYMTKDLDYARRAPDFRSFLESQIGDTQVKMNRLYDLLKLAGHPEFTQ